MKNLTHRQVEYFEKVASYYSDCFQAIYERYLRNRGVQDEEELYEDPYFQGLEAVRDGLEQMYESI